MQELFSPSISVDRQRAGNTHADTLRAPERFHLAHDPCTKDPSLFLREPLKPLFGSSLPGERFQRMRERSSLGCATGSRLDETQMASGE